MSMGTTSELHSWHKRLGQLVQSRVIGKTCHLALQIPVEGSLTVPTAAVTAPVVVVVVAPAAVAAAGCIAVVGAVAAVVVGIVMDLADVAARQEDLHPMKSMDYTIPLYLQIVGDLHNFLVLENEVRNCYVDDEYLFSFCWWYLCWLLSK